MCLEKNKKTKTLNKIASTKDLISWINYQCLFLFWYEFLIFNNTCVCRLNNVQNVARRNTVWEGSLFTVALWWGHSFVCY